MNLLRKLLDLLCGADWMPASRIVVKIASDNLTIEGVKMKITLNDTQVQPITIISTPAADAAGNPGVLNGPLTYTSSDTNVVTVTPATDTLSASVQSIGKTGSATITVTDGIISSSFDIEVVASEATGITFTVAPVNTVATTPAVVAATGADTTGATAAAATGTAAS
jgi:hypothetical protein